MIHEKLRGLGELALGSSLMTLPLWSRVLDGAIFGAHIVGAFCGAYIGIHGVIRLRSRGRRRW